VPFEVSIAILNHIADSRLVLLNNWRKRISGPTALTARSKMFSICRIRWRRASRGSSSRNCRRPRPPVRRAAGPAVSALTISICLYLRAYAMSFAYQLRQALALLEEAIARDPHYGPALGLAVANL